MRDDQDNLRVEDVADLLPNELVDRLRVELGCQALLNRVDQRELCIALPRLLKQAVRLVEEARVLESDAHACGERRQEPHVALIIAVLGPILDGDGARHLVAHEDRHPEPRLRVAVSTVLDNQYPGLVHLFERSEDKRLPRLNDDGSQSLPQLHGFRADALPLIADPIGDGHQVRRAIIEGDERVLSAEYLAQLVSHQIDDRLGVELRSQPLLDRVDEGKLRVALAGFFEQPVRFVEQPRVLQRDAHVRRDRTEQTDGRAVVGTLPVALHVDNAVDLAGD